MSRDLCTVCENMLVEPSGPSESPILIAGEFPGYQEVMEGKPFVGKAGEVLKSEAKRLGFPLKACRITNLWLHTQPDKEDDWYAGCEKESMDAFYREARGRQAILLLGSECANKLVGKPVMQIAGLRVESPYLGAPIIICAPNPAVCLQEGKGVGEFRLALKRFRDACREAGLL